MVATAIVGLILLLGVLGLYFLLRSVVHDDLHDRGTAAAADLALAAHGGGAPERLPIRVPGFYLLQITDAGGGVLAASDALRGKPAMTDRRPTANATPQTMIVPVRGVARRVYLAAIRVDSPAGPRFAYAGSPMTEIAEAKRSFIVVVSVTIPILLALVWWVIWSSVGRALRPVRLMSGELAQVTGGCLDRRVSQPSTRDEVAELAGSVNVTLERLQRFVEGQRAFVADASHELRSPLTALRIQLEVALAHPDDEDWPAVALAALSDADRLQRIVSDLLILAKLDAGVRTDREPLDLGELARTEAARRPRRVPVHLDTETAVVSGHYSDLERLLTNLLDNAERHATSEMCVTVRIDGGAAVLEVADDGSGIPEDDREKVFQRFQRLAESRSRDSGGTGLGLAIARDIAAAHGGSLVADGTDQGARFILRLPLLTAAAR